MMKILFYGRLADAIGSEVDVDGGIGWSVGQVREQLTNDNPGSAAVLAGRRVLACVGGKLVREDYVIQEGDELEFLPPASGG